MAILSSQGALTVAAAAAPPQVTTVSTSGPFFDGYRRTYAQIYRAQPAVRTVIEFFSRNIAQLGLHGFERIGDTERERLSPKHSLSRLIKRPNPSTTRYRHIEHTVQDIGTYNNAYWWKQRDASSGKLVGLIRLPAGDVGVVGSLLPTGYVWTPRSGVTPKAIAPGDIVHFRGYDPANPNVGFPAIETLRMILAEDAAASAYRRAFWKNGARVETVITRPAKTPWGEGGKAEFRKSWQEFAGGGKHAGATPILEDGMDIKDISRSFRDSEYVDSKKLTREEVAAAFHVPLPMVGILDHATFSNIKEQHKQLYQDCLGPWLTMIEEELELQLVPEFDDLDEDTFYLEFNIAEKLKGSFEEQADSLARATGRPYMTANEARARLNLSRHSNPNADDLADVAPGQGQAFSRPGNTAAVARVLQTHAARQTARLMKQSADARPEAFRQLRGRWDSELVADLTPVVGDVAAGAAAAFIGASTQALLDHGNAPWTSARIASLAERVGGLRG